MIHDIDLVLSLVGSQPAKVSALGLAILGRQEDVAQARLEFEDGCVVNLSVCASTRTRRRNGRCRFGAPKVSRDIDFGGPAADVVRPSESIRTRQFDYEALSHEDKTTFKERLSGDLLRCESLAIEPRNALADELREFVDAARGSGQPRVTGQHGRDAVAVAEAVLDSLRGHAWDGRATGPGRSLGSPLRRRSCAAPIGHGRPAQSRPPRSRLTTAKILLAPLAVRFPAISSLARRLQRS